MGQRRTFAQTSVLIPLLHTYWTLQSKLYAALHMPRKTVNSQASLLLIVHYFHMFRSLLSITFTTSTVYASGSHPDAPSVA